MRVHKALFHYLTFYEGMLFQLSYGLVFFLGGGRGVGSSGFYKGSLRVHKALFHYLVFYEGMLFQLSYGLKEPKASCLDDRRRGCIIWKGEGKNREIGMENRCRDIKMKT